MMRHGIRHALARLLAFALTAVSFPLPRTPAVIRFNEHPFARRRYAKIVAGGHRAIETVRAIFRGVIGAARALFSPGRLAFTALVLLMLGATVHGLSAGEPEILLADAVVFASSSLREAKRTLVQKSRKVIEEAQAAEEALDENPKATAEDKEKARAETERAKTEARALLEQAKDLDTDIELAEAQEQQEAELGRSQGVRAGRQDTGDPGPPGGGSEDRADQLFEGGPISAMPDGDDRRAEANRRGLYVAQVIRAIAAGNGDIEKAVAHAAKTWGEESIAYRALSSSDDVSGGATVADEMAEAIIELLRPMSAVRRLNPTVIPMGKGTLRLAKITGGAAAEYIGENDNAPKTEQKFGSVNLVFRKLAALVPVSNDLLRYATPNVDQLVRDDTTSAMAQRSDLAFIRGLGTEHAPKGFRHWAPAASVIAANSTVNLANVTEDLGKLVLALEEANVRMLRPGWIFAPRTKHYLMTVRDSNGNFAFRDEMLAGRLWDWPFSVTTQVPKNLGGGADESEVYLADMADAVIGEALALLIDASREAAYHDGSAVQAAFSRDQTVVRTLQEHDFVMRHDESIAVLTGVKWGA